MKDEYGRDIAQKRGSGMLTSFDAARAEGLYAKEPADDLSPDRLFQRRWALTIVESTLRELRKESSAANKAPTFEALRPFLGFGADPERRYEEIAATLGVPTGRLLIQRTRPRRQSQSCGRRMSGPLLLPAK